MAEKVSVSITEPSEVIKYSNKVVLVDNTPVRMSLVRMRRSFLLVINNAHSLDISNEDDEDEMIRGFINPSLSGLSLGIGDNNSPLLYSENAISSATMASRLSKKLNSGRPVYVANNVSAPHDTLEMGEFTAKLYLKVFQFGVIPRIGLEVHAQLDLGSKLFSEGGTASNKPPNSQLDLFDMALPGTLPKLNATAIRAAIITGLGLNCEIQKMIHFDRKNYFYPDMPAGFQITQYNKPVARGGFIEFIVTTHHKSIIAHTQQYDLVKYLYSEDRKLIEEFEPYIKKSKIKQIQLEQDSAKSLHDSHCTLVDYNRSGSGLMEIVFEPDICHHHEASSLVRELTLILKSVKTCDGELQEGSLRVDANVSIQSINGKVITDSPRVELKNLNSLKSLNRAIQFEVQRQATLINEGTSVTQESRFFDTKSGKTVPLRLKEEAVDYRYVPEPSIPPIILSQERIISYQKELPALMPVDIRKRLIDDYNIDLRLVMEIMEIQGLYSYMQLILTDKDNFKAEVVADFLIYTINRLRSILNSPIKVDLSKNSEFMMRLSPKKLQSLFELMFSERISFANAYEVAKYMYISSDQSHPCDIVQKFNWHLITDEKTIHSLCNDLINDFKPMAKKYAKKGQKKHLRLLLDRLCETTNDKISVKKAIEAIDKQLKPPKEFS